MFTEKEILVLKEYLEEGGSLLITLDEGGENKSFTNINYLLEQYGISFNNDTVIRTTFCKYTYPKECLITNGIMNKEIVRAAKGLPKPLSKKDEYSKNKLGKKYNEGKESLSINENTGITFVYPFGSTLNVQKPSFPLLSSGPISYPINRPLCAACVSNSKKGKIIAMGSSRIFEDEYIDKEDNSKLMNVIFSWLLTNEIDLTDYVPEEIDLPERQFIPDIMSMAERLRSCLEVKIR